MLKPRGLYRTDGKRPDGVTMIPWVVGKRLVWDFTVVLAPSRLNQGSLCNPGATEAKARKTEKYREVIGNGHIFQPLAMEVQGSLCKNSEISKWNRFVENQLVEPVCRKLRFRL